MIMKKLAFVLLLGATLYMTSCASIFCGAKKKVTFESNVPVKSANLTIDGRKYTNITFPFVAKVKRGFSDSVVEAEAEGYEKTSLVIEKKFNAVSVINLIEVLGWGIDAATGAITKPQYKKYHLDFKPAQKLETGAEFMADAGNSRIGYDTKPSKSSGAVSNKPLVKSDVDMNIPVTDVKSENTFVLIIANENYEFVDDVKFALNDGEIFREYCIKTLGIPERQVWFYKNASAGIIAGGVDKLLQAMNIFDSPKIIVYYCGHGIPDDKTGEAYIVPTDGKGTNVATCYSLNKLYTTLSSSKASSVTYFMDACFTGANRDGSMLVAARGVAREAKKEVIKGNTVVFSAASGDETAMPFAEKGHGLFTYYLLKKLQETKGNVSYGELAEYIGKNVKREAFLTNEKPQTPVVATSETNMKNWKTMNVR